MPPELRIPKPGPVAVFFERGLYGAIFGLLAIGFGEHAWSMLARGTASSVFTAGGLCVAFSWMTWRQVAIFLRSVRGEEDPAHGDKTGPILLGLILLWAVWFFWMCMPYFMRPWNNLKEMKAAIAARVPEVARFDELDAAGRRALAPALAKALEDGDDKTRAGARYFLGRIAVAPGAPAAEMVPALAADLRKARSAPDGAAMTLTLLGEPGKAALIAALDDPNFWTVDAAALELSRMKPVPPEAIEGLRRAMARMQHGQRQSLQFTLDRMEGRR